jgi:hypothetical protein
VRARGKKKEQAVDTFNKALLLVALTALIVVFGPLITMWALNTLFGLGIESNGQTWFATLWLSGLVGGAAYKASGRS